MRVEKNEKDLEECIHHIDARTREKILLSRQDCLLHTGLQITRAQNKDREEEEEEEEKAKIVRRKRRGGGT